MPGHTIEKTFKTYVEDVLLTRGGWKSAIVTYLDVETAKLDAPVGNVEAAVDRLQGYRVALITTAVAGKIDLRHAAA